MPNMLDMEGFGASGVPVRSKLSGRIPSPVFIEDGRGTLVHLSFGTDIAGGYLSTVGGLPRFGAVASGVNPTYWSLHAYGSSLVMDGIPAIGIASDRVPCASRLGVGSTLSSAATLLYADAQDILALRRTTNAQGIRLYRDYTDPSNYSRWAVRWNTSTAVLHAEGAGTGTDGSVAFNDAALATDATRGFVMLPSCAGTPTGTPADIPTGQCPAVVDTSAARIWLYVGGVWKYAALT